MVLVGTDPRTIGEPQHDWYRRMPAATEPDSSEVARHLVERRVHEAFKLHFSDGPASGYGHADGGAEDPRFVERSVDDTFIPEGGLEAFG